MLKPLIARFAYVFLVVLLLVDIGVHLRPQAAIAGDVPGVIRATRIEVVGDDGKPGVVIGIFKDAPGIIIGASQESEISLLALSNGPVVGIHNGDHDLLLDEKSVTSTFQNSKSLISMRLDDNNLPTLDLAKPGQEMWSLEYPHK